MQMIDMFPSVTEPTDRLYRYREYNPPVPPSFHGYALYGESYRGFFIVRETDEQILYAIKTKEHGEPPIMLRSKFTTLDRAKRQIDAFWIEEERNLGIEPKKE